MGQSGSLRGKLLLFIVSFFGVGLISRKIPGTVGSFVATGILLMMPKSSILALICSFISFFLGWICCNFYIPKYETDKDPGYIVIDEACGIFLSGAVIYYFGYTTTFDILLSFLLFRLFDIFKPYPIHNIENSLKTYQNTVSLGIMLDDVIASIFASATQIILKALAFSVFRLCQ